MSCRFMPNNDSIAVSRHMMVDRGNYATVAAYIYIFLCVCAPNLDIRMIIVLKLHVHIG